MVLNEYVCRYFLMTMLCATTGSEWKSKSVVAHGKAELRYSLSEGKWLDADKLNRMNRLCCHSVGNKKGFSLSLIKCLLYNNFHSVQQLVSGYIN